VQQRRSISSRFGLLRLLAGVVAGIVGVIGVFWVVSQTDTGMMCAAPYSSADEPGACSVYDLPFWLLIGGAVAFLAGLALSVAALVTNARGHTAPKL
jgi:predicted anti-sigma-YlaC factor YlaD